MTEDELQRHVEGDGQQLGLLHGWADAPALPRSNARLCDATLLAQLLLSQTALHAQLPDGVADRSMGSTERAVISRGNVRHSMKKCAHGAASALSK